MSRVQRSVVLLVLLISCQVQAEDLIMARSVQTFPEAMLTLQTSLREHGYQIARVQRVDIGLSKKGYVTDKYRVVFLGKKDEIRYLIHKYPELVPFMPPKVSIFAEGQNTLVLTTSPDLLAAMVENKDRVIFRRWQNDIYSVFDDVRNAE